jgi:hypothetical protein
MFKKTFASKGNEDITSGLFHDFFGFAPESLTFIEPYSIMEYTKLLKNGEFAKLRQIIKDIRAKITAASFIAEMQLKKTRYYDERSFLYLCDEYRRGYGEGAEEAKTEIRRIRNTGAIFS